MITDIYYVALLIMACLLLYLGMHLIFGAVPLRLKNTVYTDSRKTMGAAFLTIAGAVSIFFFSGFGTIAAQLGVSINLTCYYIVANLIAFSFTTLVKHKLDFKHPWYKWGVISWFIYPLPIWCAYLYGNKHITFIVHVSSAIVLLGSILFQVIYIFRSYRKTIKKSRDYYADDISVHMVWIIKSIYYIIGIGILSGIFAFAIYMPKWISVLYIIALILVFIYVFENYIKFMVVFSEIREGDKSTSIDLIPEIDEDNTQLASSINRSIAEQLEVWIYDKSFCEKRITIQSTATAVSTNRAYLSSYINATYNCSFRIWISKLRIEEAKKILSSNKSISITAVADNVGFMSLTSFTHTFTNMEGLSPKKWAETNCIAGEERRGEERRGEERRGFRN